MYESVIYRVAEEQRENRNIRRMTTIQVHRWGFHLYVNTEIMKEPAGDDGWKNITLEDAIAELKAAAEMLEREQKKK